MEQIIPRCPDTEQSMREFLLRVTDASRAPSGLQLATCLGVIFDVLLHLEGPDNTVDISADILGDSVDRLQAPDPTPPTHH